MELLSDLRNIDFSKIYQLLRY